MDQFRPRDDQSPVREIPRGVEGVEALLNNFLKGRGTWLIILIVVLLYLASGIYIVRGAGEKGVVLLFGKLHSLTDSGLRYRLPKPFMSNAIVGYCIRYATLRSAFDRTGHGRGLFPPSP